MQIKQEKSQYLLLAIYHAAVNGGQLNTDLGEIKNIFKNYFPILTTSGKTPWGTLQSFVRHSPSGVKYFKSGFKYSTLKGRMSSNQYASMANEARDRLISLNSAYSMLRSS